MNCADERGQEQAVDSGPTVAVLIVNYRTAYAVKELLDSLANEDTHRQVCISIWDNSCDDEEFKSLERVAALFQDVYSLICCSRSGENLGYAAGNNAAWTSLQERTLPTAPDVIVVINPDVKLAAGSISDFVQEIRNDARSLFSAPTMTCRGLMTGQGALNRRTGQSRQVSEGSEPVNGEQLYPGGHFMGISVELWNFAHGFSDDFFLYCEEVDLAMRLQDGYSELALAVSKTVRVSHSEGLSTARPRGDQSKSLVTYEHATRSRIVLFRKHKSLQRNLFSVTMLRVLWALQFLAKGKVPEFKKILSGIYDGYRCHPQKGH